MGLYRVPGSSTGRLRRVEWSALSDAEGSFRFDGVGQGLYRLCGSAPSGAWLDPCDWGLPLTTTDLSFAQNTADVTMTLRRGATVPVRIDDPGQFLSQSGAKTPGAGLLLGFATDSSLFHTLPLTSADQTGRNYQIVIPFDTTVKLIITSSHLQIADAAGLMLPVGVTSQIAVTVPSGAQPPLLRFVVTGGAK